MAYVVWLLGYGNALYGLFMEPGYMNCVGWMKNAYRGDWNLE